MTNIFLGTIRSANQFLVRLLLNQPIRHGMGNHPTRSKFQFLRLQILVALLLTASLSLDHFYRPVDTICTQVSQASGHLTNSIYDVVKSSIVPNRNYADFLVPDFFDLANTTRRLR